ncbi:MAG: putative DNA primase/helicase [Paracoccaceae bacterium]|jgi:putative DNA primase/helicase
MNAETIAIALGGKRAGSDWMARCPAHSDRTPSMSLADGDTGNVVVCCHAGCPQEAVIAALRDKGVWPGKSDIERPDPALIARECLKREREAQARIDYAVGLWRQADPAAGTPVESYLRWRGIMLPVPETIRFVPKMKHRDGGVWPSQIAVVTDGMSNTPVGVHRTYLAPDGAGKAPVSPAKMMLGRCRGGAVRLAPTDNEVLIGEGIETTLSVMQVTGKPGWAALSTSGMTALCLPDYLTEITILADGDPPGRDAANTAAGTWAREGRNVRIAHAPDGQDFNDRLMAAEHTA